jgi:hypothetical protein
LNWEDHPGQPDGVSGPAILRKKIHHVSQLKDVPPPEVPPSQSHKYDSRDGLRHALRMSLDRIGWTSSGVNILDIPWELNNEIDFDGLSIYDGVRSAIALQTFRELNKDFDVFGQDFKDLFPILDKSYDLMQFGEFVANMAWEDKVWPEGRLVLTQKGYMGGVICHALPGDEVCILRGCKLPVILMGEI